MLETSQFNFKKFYGHKCNCTNSKTDACVILIWGSMIMTLIGHPEILCTIDIYLN